MIDTQFTLSKRVHCILVVREQEQKVQNQKNQPKRRPQGGQKKRNSSESNYYLGSSAESYNVAVIVIEAA